MFIQILPQSDGGDDENLYNKKKSSDEKWKKYNFYEVPEMILLNQKRNFHLIIHPKIKKKVHDYSKGKGLHCFLIYKHI